MKRRSKTQTGQKRKSLKLNACIIVEKYALFIMNEFDLHRVISPKLQVYD